MEELESFENFEAAISDLLPPENLKSVLDGLKSSVSGERARLRKDATAIENSSFCTTLATVNKRLKTIKSRLKRNHLVEMSWMEALQKNLKDLQNIAFRQSTSTEKGITVTSLIKNTAARDFWTTSFGEVIFPHSNERRCEGRSVLSGCRGRVG